LLPEIEELVLPNGFRALLVERRGLPVVASMLWYQVGSRDECTGETGLSHFLEHMMFKGTERFAKGEIDLLTAKMGGSNNAFTDHDNTAYYFALAADRWETALEIEADRMRHCLLDSEEFAAEKQVVLEELAMGEDDPWRSLFQATEALAFQAHSYRHPIIGWRQDVEQVSVGGMRSYYERHYAPDRAFLVAVGDFDLARTRQRVAELFEPLVPSGHGRTTTVAEAVPAGERRGVIEAPTSVRRIAIAFPTCRVGDPDDYVLDIVSQALGGGRPARLYRRLVLDSGMATYVSCYNETRQDPGLFWITAEVQDGVPTEKVETAIREELDRLAAEGLEEDELRRIRAQVRSSFQFEDETALDQAMKIGRFEASAQGGYKVLDNILDTYAAVDSARVQEVMQRYFRPNAARCVWSVPRTTSSRKAAS